VSRSTRAGSDHPGAAAKAAARLDFSWRQDNRGPDVHEPVCWWQQLVAKERYPEHRLGAGGGDVRQGFKQRDDAVFRESSDQHHVQAFSDTQRLQTVVFFSRRCREPGHQLHSQGRLQGFDLASTVFNFMLPSGTVLTTNAAPAQQSAATASAAARGGAPQKAQRGEGGAGRNPAHPEDEASSLAGLGGYHGSVHAGEDTIYYAVGVFSETLPNGRDNGIVAFDQPWKDVVATFYHELNEARTDADVEDAIKARAGGAKFLGWMSRQGEECGDFPIFEAGPRLDLVMQEVLLTNGSTTVPVQFQFSNAVHGPEGPIAAPHTTPARARARSRRLRKLHQHRALNARRRRVRRALRALRQGRLRMARRIESKLFRGKKLKSLAVRRRRLASALGRDR